MQNRGRLTEWNEERGFGFVTSLDDSSRAFVHISAFPRDMRRPRALDLLTYQTRHDDRGRLQAIDVRFMTQVRSRDATPSLAATRHEVPMWIPLAVLAVVLLGTLVFSIGLAAGLFVGYVVMSATTFVAYAMDKSSAQAGRFRTQESALHLLEIAGGWPGALIAQRLLRHKTKKQPFQIVFWACAALNVIGVIAIALSSRS